MWKVGMTAQPVFIMGFLLWGITINQNENVTLKRKWLTCGCPMLQSMPVILWVNLYMTYITLELKSHTCNSLLYLWFTPLMLRTEWSYEYIIWHTQCELFDISCVCSPTKQVTQSSTSSGVPTTHYVLGVKEQTWVNQALETVQLSQSGGPTVGWCHLFMGFNWESKGHL